MTEDSDEDQSLGSIWVDGIVNTVMAAIRHRASRRNLDLIGPHREDVIGYEIVGSGMVWSALSDRREAMDIIAGHTDNDGRSRCRSFGGGVGNGRGLHRRRH